jgi:hypothetical protein
MSGPEAHVKYYRVVKRVERERRMHPSHGQRHTAYPGSPPSLLANLLESAPDSQRGNHPDSDALRSLPEALKMHVV